MDFTQEQQEVIAARGADILVSAAAGSGKTAVLVERIVRTVCDGTHPVDIDRLLVVTFTRAAASEMRERIHKRIAEELSDHPEDPHIQKQYALVHRARIMTIDAFCQSVLRDHFQELDMDPDFRILDDAEKKLLEQDVLREVLEESYAQGGEEFLSCVEFFCPGGDDAALERGILELHGYADSFPWPEAFLKEREADHAIHTPEEFAASAVGEELAGARIRLLQGFASGYRELALICEEPDGPGVYAEMIERESRELEEVLRKAEDPESCGRALAAFLEGMQALSRAKDPNADPRKREYVKKARTAAKAGLKSLLEEQYTVPLKEQIRRIEACEVPVRAMLELTLRFRERLAEEKARRKVLDFGDIEHAVLRLFYPEDGSESAAAREYNEWYHEVLIDEYQDSNSVQEMLLEAVCKAVPGKTCRFMVGDVKQSIYAFRQARPDLFLEKLDTYAEEGAQRRLFLTRNFRSRREVTDSVNAVFSRIMTRETGGISYDEKAALYPQAPYPAGPGYETELMLFDDTLFGEEEEAPEKVQAEAVALADRIRELITSGFQVSMERKADAPLRPVRYGDIVILHRSAGTVSEAYRKVFEERGIPLYSTGQKGYFSATEVQELLLLLRVISNPLQDIPLFGCLRSVFGGFTDEELARIRMDARDEALYTSLCRAAEEGQEKAVRFLEMLKGYRERSICQTVREMLDGICEEHHYLEYVTALPGGSARRANVEMLLKRASDFEKTSYLGLVQFIRYMDQLKDFDTDFGEAGYLEENADVVRLMTIHKSKGLEFPVVILAGMGKQFNFSGENRLLPCDRRLGIACDYADPEQRIKAKTLRKSAIMKRKRQELLEEELRLLYVAMTRASEKLILVGWRGDAAQALEDADLQGRERIAYGEFMDSKCFLDFLMPVLKAAKIRAQVVQAQDLAKNEDREDRIRAERLSLLADAGSLASPELLQSLRDRFSWQYPYGYLKEVYTKTTVSELKMAAMADADEGAFHQMEKREREIYVPSFARQGEEDGGITGTVRGNAYHRVMELLDFDRILGAVFGGFPDDRESYARSLETKNEEVRESLQVFLKEETESLRLREEYAGAVSIPKLMAFLQSDLAYRMWRASRAGKLRREQPFVIGIPASRLLGHAVPEEETLLIQGIIDGYFPEENGIVLLDYKTDKVSSMEELFARYKTQLEYYREALEKLTGLPVKEKGLYSFSLSRWECI
ncbi:MAG: helicase-exonuclease AddAB subunit AddA [Lachnospiraceae bacterium]|nr:helicase-exonuclease AddAB subunit AddA [Lachnospiraceae bacterium]